MRPSRKRPANGRLQNGETSPELKTALKRTNGFGAEGSTSNSILLEGSTSSSFSVEGSTSNSFSVEGSTSNSFSVEGSTSNSSRMPQTRYECKICLQHPESPQMTKCCGVIFCSSCLIQAFARKLRCPSCTRIFNSPEENAFPYEPPMEKPSVSQPCSSANGDKSDVISNESGIKINDRPIEVMEINELDQFISSLNKRRQKLVIRETDQTMRHTEIMLDEMVKKATMEIQAMNSQLSSIKGDLEHLRRRHSLSVSESSWPPNSTSSTSAVVPQMDLSNDPALDRIKKHKKSLTGLYLDFVSANMGAGAAQTQEMKVVATEKRLGAFGEVLQGVAKYGEIKRLCTLNYDMEPVPQMSIVSSLEFDKDCERFVVAGVTKKIKIFHFENVKENPKGLHYPLTQLKCRSKISNISWNPHEKNILCSSDYDGHVTIWDTEESKIVRTFEEHEKRCWTVHFNNVDSNLIASGSDDSKVKLWNLNCERSVTTIDAKVNVCCVYFSPTDRHQLVFGSADHCVHLYDIRNTSKPYNIFKGHRKAVSYVRYISEDQVVSASTDSTLRVWSVKTGRCLRELRGHTNEKNFVGLSGFGDHIMCGSENNRVFFYHKSLAEPVCSYYVAKDGALEEENEGFVSSVCWKKDSDYALVANSQGRVQLLQIL